MIASQAMKCPCLCHISSFSSEAGHYVCMWRGDYEQLESPFYPRIKRQVRLFLYLDMSANVELLAACSTNGMLLDVSVVALVLRGTSTAD
jgi:hypothetical protein